MRVGIIGHGVVGNTISRKMREYANDEIVTCDIIKGKADYEDIKEMPFCETIIIAVVTTEQVIEVISKLHPKTMPYLISIESTCQVGTWHKIKDIVGKDIQVIMFPERIYPRDEFHGIFNQPRIMGGDIKEGRAFYDRYIIRENIIEASTADMASLVKLTENSYRHILISIAEELKMIFGDRFEELRKLCNTKWNIDIMEAREGISGLCLPKDIRILHEYTKSDLLEMVMLIDEKYRKELEDGGKVLVSQISNNR